MTSVANYQLQNDKPFENKYVIIHQIFEVNNGHFLTKSS